MSVNASSGSSFHPKLCDYLNYATTGLRATVILPVSIIIFYLGFQQYRQQHLVKMASHSDIFTYNLAAMELIWVLGCLCYTCGLFGQIPVLTLVGERLTVIVLYGEIIIHVLTCAERYLAVLLPVVYIRLKNARWVRIRNITIGCVWVLCFALSIIDMLKSHIYTLIALFFLLAVSIIATCFCSVSVLCVLIRPGPGDGAKEKKRVDQSKRKAFYTITATSAALCLWFLGLLVGLAVMSSHLTTSCLVLQIVAVCNIPSYLVSPFLYLYKTGKLSCCIQE